LFGRERCQRFLDGQLGVVLGVVFLEPAVAGDGGDYDVGRFAAGQCPLGVGPGSLGLRELRRETADSRPATFTGNPSGATLLGPRTS